MLLVFAVILALSQVGYSHPSPRIINGTVAEPHSVPSIVKVLLIDEEGNQWNDCNGVLISAKFVVTEAYCIRLGSSRPPTTGYVTLGAHDLSLSEEATRVRIKIEYIEVHNHYDPETNDNNLALLELKHPVLFSDAIQPAILPDPTEANTTTHEGETLTVCGWGATCQYCVDPYNGPLLCYQDVVVPCIDPNITVHDYDICASEADGQETGLWDAGAPLIIDGVVIGIATGSVFTRLDYYIDWIQEYIHRGDGIDPTQSSVGPIDSITDGGTTVPSVTTTKRTT